MAVKMRSPTSGNDQIFFRKNNEWDIWINEKGNGMQRRDVSKGRVHRQLVLKLTGSSSDLYFSSIDLFEISEPLISSSDDTFTISVARSSEVSETDSRCGFGMGRD